MRLILPLFLFGMLVTSCIENNYDLSEIDTDGVVIGDEFRLPLATVTVSMSELGKDGTESPDFDIDVLEFHKGAPQSVSRMLRATINAGLEYEVWRHKIGIGLLYSARFWEYKTLHNITGSVNFHPIRWFTLTGSYSVIDNRGGAVGLGLNLCPNWINFFIGTDVLITKHTPQFVPVRQSIMNVTLGIGVPIGKRSHRIPAYVYGKDRR